MERYLEGEDIEVTTLIDDLETAVARGTFHPVIPVCASSGIGLDALLEVLIGGFPSPLEHPLPAVSGIDGSERAALSADLEGPLAAEVVRTSADAYVGRVSLVRVFSGTLRADTTVHISGHHALIPAQRSSSSADGGPRQRRAPRARLLADGRHPQPGGGVRRGRHLRAHQARQRRDRRHGVGRRRSPAARMLEPARAAAPGRDHRPHPGRRGRAGEDAREDRRGGPDPALDRNQETHQTVLWCMGEAHADVVLSRLRAGGAEVDTEPVQVAMRETIAKPARVTGRHVKQSGGHGQYAVCHVEFEPLPRGEGFVFESKVVGGAVPTQYIPSVEKGLGPQLERGLSDAKHPAVDLKATLVDGKAHSVDSSDAAFQTAGALALREAAAACGVVLLEPIDEIEVRIPDDYLGAVLGDLSGRRGRVLGTEVAGPGRTMVRAEVPSVQLIRYAVDLRAMTSGAAAFTRSFARYEEAPQGR
jgi:elongation factor G